MSHCVPCTPSVPGTLRCCRTTQCTSSGESAIQSSPWQADGDVAQNKYTRVVARAVMGTQLCGRVAGGLCIPPIKNTTSPTKGKDISRIPTEYLPAVATHPAGRSECRHHPSCPLCRGGNRPLRCGPNCPRTAAALPPSHHPQFHLTRPCTHHAGHTGPLKPFCGGSCKDNNYYSCTLHHLTGR